VPGEAGALLEPVHRAPEDLFASLQPGQGREAGDEDAEVVAAARWPAARSCYRPSGSATIRFRTGAGIWRDSFGHSGRTWDPGHAMPMRWPLIQPVTALSCLAAWPDRPQTTRGSGTASSGPKWRISGRPPAAATAWPMTWYGSSRCSSAERTASAYLAIPGDGAVMPGLSSPIPGRNTVRALRRV
jgi:hypothetical protein